MSRKNHALVNGRLLQTDKKFSALKEKQKAKIAEWLYSSYRQSYLDCGRLPGKQEDEEIVGCVLDKIEAAQIWILAGEIFGYYRRRKKKLENRLRKEFTVGKTVEIETVSSEDISTISDPLMSQNREAYETLAE